jgi:hypothetical protein
VCEGIKASEQDHVCFLSAKRVRELVLKALSIKDWIYLLLGGCVELQHSKWNYVTC